MSLSRGEITHVSDTALMVAACRALASESPDGFVQARYGDAPGAAATWNDADALMSAETPRCRRERITADLNDAAERRTIYAAAGPAPALMITEGLLMYLPAATVEALAAEAWQESGIAQWMSDITTTAFEKAINMDRMSLRNVQASDFLQGEQILDAVRRHGWVTAARRSYITDMAFAIERIPRLMGDLPQPADPPPVPPDDPTGVHRFARG